MPKLKKTSNSNFYKVVKSHFGQTNSLTQLPTRLSKQLVAFRTRNHRLPIEVGRWRGVPANERICPYCKELGDEFHYILICQKFANYRKKYIKDVYYLRPNIIKLRNLFNTENCTEIKNLSIFCNPIMNHFKNI